MNETVLKIIAVLYAIPHFMITAEILARSLANFQCRKAGRYMTSEKKQ